MIHIHKHILISVVDLVDKRDEKVPVCHRTASDFHTPAHKKETFRTQNTLLLRKEIS